MADFSSHSDTDDEAVDRILAEATDHVVLEQLAAVNLSSVSDSALPSDLENRFRSLKTFSSSSSSSTAQTQKAQLTFAKTLPAQPDTKRRTAVNSTDSTCKLTYPTSHDLGPDQVENPDEKSDSRVRKPRSRGHSSSSPSSSASSNYSLEDKNPSKSKAREEKKVHGVGTRGYGSDLRHGSLSPPRKTGCLWCFPKRVSKSKSFSKPTKGGAGIKYEFDWDLTDDVLKDIHSFSFKEQKRTLKRAVEEQKKISKEAEKIVKLVKQASARMDAHSHGIGRGIHDDDGLSD